MSLSSSLCDSGCRSGPRASAWIGLEQQKGSHSERSCTAMSLYPNGARSQCQARIRWEIYRTPKLASSATYGGGLCHAAPQEPVGSVNLSNSYPSWRHFLTHKSRSGYAEGLRQGAQGTAALRSASTRRLSSLRTTLIDSAMQQGGRTQRSCTHEPLGEIR
jgi:hypothetical protein